MKNTKQVPVPGSPYECDVCWDGTHLKRTVYGNSVRCWCCGGGWLAPYKPGRLHMSIEFRPTKPHDALVISATQDEAMGMRSAPYSKDAE